MSAKRCIISCLFVLCVGCDYKFVFENSAIDTESNSGGDTGTSSAGADTDRDMDADTIADTASDTGGIADADSDSDTGTNTDTEPVTETDANSETDADSDTDGDSWKPRVIHTTDLEVDDQQSMVHQLVLANWFDLEGLIVSTSCWSKSQRDKGILDSIVSAYGEVVSNLKAHDPEFPSLEYLESIAVTGQTGFGMEDVGDDRDSPGSELIIASVDRDDPRPVWVTCWGGCNTIAQAIWKVQSTRSETELADFLSKLRVYDSLGQDDTGAWMTKSFPSLLYIRAKEVYSWQPSDSWVDEHVQSHGELGTVYPDWEEENIYEGDSAAILHLIPNGLHDPDQVDQGGWGGRFGLEKQEGLRGMDCNGELLENEEEHDPYFMYNEAAESISRWQDAILSDFEARMDWSTTSEFGDANHHPIAVVNGDTGRKVVEITASPGSDVDLSAAGSSDPDGDGLAYSWLFYEEPSSYNGSLTIQNNTSDSATLSLPSDAVGETLHVILELRDNGSPSLTSYRRVILNVSP
jgi:hypothetical protein